MALRGNSLFPVVRPSEECLACVLVHIGHSEECIAVRSFYWSLPKNKNKTKTKHGIGDTVAPQGHHLGMLIRSQNSEFGTPGSENCPTAYKNSPS